MPPPSGQTKTCQGCGKTWPLTRKYFAIWTLKDGRKRSSVNCKQCTHPQPDVAPANKATNWPNPPLPEILKPQYWQFIRPEAAAHKLPGIING